MRIFNQWSGRPQYYDRNPLTKVFAGDTTQAGPYNPGAVIDYTVPANRKAFVSYGFVWLTRKTLARTVNWMHAALVLKLSGGATLNLLIAHTRVNTKFNWTENHSNFDMVLNSGDAMGHYLFDLSTGGTCEFQYSFYVVEFDG